MTDSKQTRVRTSMASPVPERAGPRPRRIGHDRRDQPDRTGEQGSLEGAFALDQSFAFARQVVLPPWDRLDIWQVGGGGTGSFVAQMLAKLVRTWREQGADVRYTIVDPDVVEEHNLARQHFHPREVGANKAIALATRYAGLYGIEIRAVPKLFGKSLVPCQELHTHRYGGDSRRLGLLVGCVDNAAARRAMTDCLTPPTRRSRSDAYVWQPELEDHSRLWHVDAGNSAADEAVAGQVLVASTTDENRLRRAFDLPGLCRELPAVGYAGTWYPDLLIARRDEQAPAGCVTIDQALFVNQIVAAHAVQLIYELLTHQLKRFATTFAAAAGRADSKYVTPAAVGAAIGVASDQFFAEPRVVADA